jgi:hypothetical protein
MATRDFKARPRPNSTRESETQEPTYEGLWGFLAGAMVVLIVEIMVHGI